jgi:hypothetical protein
LVPNVQHANTPRTDFRFWRGRLGAADARLELVRRQSRHAIEGLAA